MSRQRWVGVLVMSVGFTVSVIVQCASWSAASVAGDTDAQDRIAQGFAIAPVPLNLAGKDRRLVGLGSYIVNAQGGCNDCHTEPAYAPGHDPFVGGDGRFNAAGYLKGGKDLGAGIVSSDITPDATGLPGGETVEQFVHVMTTGHDPDPAQPGRLLQVMPWPVYRHMIPRDLEAIYEYLRAIPSSSARP